MSWSALIWQLVKGTLSYSTTMKYTPIFLVPLILVFLSITACKTDDSMTKATPIPPDSSGAEANPINPNSANRLRIRVGASTFTATLLNTPSVTAFKAQLPMTLSMNELNGNEKFIDLPKSLPANASNPGTIQAGDLMLYGSSTLVLFYETFRTSYSYTRLGRVDNPSGLATTLGSGSVTVTFALE